MKRQSFFLSPLQGGVPVKQALFLPHSYTRTTCEHLHTGDENLSGESPDLDFGRKGDEETTGRGWRKEEGKEGEGTARWGGAERRRATRGERDFGEPKGKCLEAHQSVQIEIGE